MRHHVVSAVLLSCVLFLGGCAATGATARPDLDELKRQVTETETAFAATMAARDHAGFVSFLGDETLFFNSKGPIRGKAAVAADWKKFYEGPQPPFSWKPTQVEVLDSGTLAISSGPVYDPSGKLVAVFNSIWRREAAGQWRIIFDKGGCACPNRNEGQK